MKLIIYEVDFDDGHVKEYSTNTIDDNMLTQVDSDGFTLTMMTGIIDYWKDVETSVTKDGKYIATKCGQKNIRETTVVWQLMVQWRDQSESCIHLKDLKESHPIEVADSLSPESLQMNLTLPSGCHTRCGKGT